MEAVEWTYGHMDIFHTTSKTEKFKRVAFAMKMLP